MLSAVMVGSSCGKPVSMGLYCSLCLWVCVLAGSVDEHTALVFSEAVVAVFLSLCILACPVDEPGAIVFSVAVFIALSKPRRAACSVVVFYVDVVKALSICLHSAVGRS